MTYPETLDYLYQQLPMFQRVGPKAFKKDLTNIRLLATALGDPQDQFKSVHIAGTNGKGSVSNMLASVLQEAGLKVGLYTSPHLRSFTERIRINGKTIPEADVIDFVVRNQSVMESIRPSFFEVTVGMAFDHFAREKVDIAVIEVGLGGRLDSTNIITPEVGAITNISLDHTAFLGDTRSKIAGEKAGIFKPGKTFVIGENDPETRAVFEAAAVAAGAKLVFVDEFLPKINVVESDLEGQTVEFREKDGGLVELRLDLVGEFQMLNAATAWILTEELLQQGWNIPPKARWNSFGNVQKNTGFRGRMTVLDRSPLVLTDVGHNEAGVAQVLGMIRDIPYQRLHFVWGMVNDKDTSAILRMLPPEASYYFVAPDVPRGLPADQLQAEARACGLQGEAHGSVAAGLKAARAAAASEDLVFVGGSTFVVAEII